MQLKSILISATLLITSSLSAWWDTGHLTVAQIAYDDLLPEVRDQVDSYLKEYEYFFPDHNDFLSASLWADDIAHNGFKALSSWHSAVRLHDPEEILSKREHKERTAKLRANDAVWAMQECIKTLRHPNASPWTKGFMLRMLIHIIGDLHQPFNCIDGYSAVFPKGDHSGREFTIQHPLYPNLRMLFNSGFGLVHHRPSRPLSNEDRAVVRAIVSGVRELFPREELPELRKNKNTFESWCYESHHVAIQFGYEALSLEEAPTKDAMKAGRQAAAKQLALAGYRLADLLNHLISPAR